MGWLYDHYGKQDRYFIYGFLAALEMCSYYKIDMGGKITQIKQIFNGKHNEDLHDAMKNAVQELAECPEDFDAFIKRACE